MLTQLKRLALAESDNNARNCMLVPGYILDNDVFCCFMNNVDAGMSAEGADTGTRKKRMPDGKDGVSTASAGQIWPARRPRHPEEGE